MSPWLGLGIGAAAGYVASVYAESKLLPKYDKNTPLASEGHPCGDSFLGPLGPCTPPLVCRPDWFGSTCVTPKTETTITLVTLSLMLGGAYMGYRLAR